MDKEIKKGLIRLAGHLNSRGHSKIAQELKEISEEPISLEKESDTF